VANKQMAAALKFMKYDYQFVMGAGAQRQARRRDPAES